MGPCQDYAEINYLMVIKQCYRVRLDKQHGFSLFEMVVTILLIGVLVSAAIDRLLQIQIDAEKHSVMRVIGILESAVYLQVAEMVVKEGLNSLQTLENANPMDYLQKLPSNYVGVKEGGEIGRVPFSSWYFDPTDDVLVYKVRNTKYFESDIEGEPRIKLKLSLVYSNDIKRRDSSIQGMKLESLHEYHWRFFNE